MLDALFCSLPRFFLTCTLFFRQRELILNYHRAMTQIGLGSALEILLAQVGAARLVCIGGKKSINTLLSSSIAENWGYLCSN
jgi:hypothetical protein